MTNNEEKEEIQPEENEPETQVEEEIIEPTEPPVEEPCDPLTMTCNEMRDQIIKLSDRRVTLDIGIKSLDDTKKIIPSEALDKAYNESLEEKQKIDSEIYGLFERFTVCTTKPAEEETEETQEK